MAPDPRRPVRSGRKAVGRRFADPWGQRRTAPIPRAADLSGRELPVAAFRRGGASAFSAREQASLPPERSMLAELRRRVSATMARYRMQEWCTEAQLRTIEALWIEGVSLRELAKREGVSPAAIEARIAALHTKAPEFYRWWNLKNRSRRRR